ncbi:uncharacterized protein LOC115174410, partial [Salmo trutta]|uniref:uncharacterized protein LOC115174410 n=1 Tax=Salmo trutta TaxID=8032 RepID=UPI00113156D2
MNNIVANLLLNVSRLDQMFTDASSKDHCLACALRFRGNMQHIPVRDHHVNLEEKSPGAQTPCGTFRLRPTLPFVSWNQEGWKTGLCSMPPVDHSLLALANNTCVKPTFIELRDRITKLYRKKAHLHHYLLVDGMQQGSFNKAISSLMDGMEKGCFTEAIFSLMDGMEQGCFTEAISSFSYLMDRMEQGCFTEAISSFSYLMDGMEQGCFTEAISSFYYLMDGTEQGCFTEAISSFSYLMDGTAQGCFTEAISSFSYLIDRTEQGCFTKAISSFSYLMDRTEQGCFTEAISSF